MAKLILRFEQNILREVGLREGELTIGRLPDNGVQIDNLAVSGHHAKIYWDQDHYVVEDLGSLNGTYVNNQRVGKSALKSGDQITIGKHLVQFKDEGQKAPAPPPPEEKSGPAAPKLEATVVLDTKKTQDMIAASAAAGPGAGPLGLSKPAGAPPVKERIGILNVLEGRTDQRQYVLTGKMTMIGKSNMATIRLKGFFAPKTAALISKRENKYFIAASDQKSKIKINGAEAAGQQELNEGDIIEIAGVKAAFTLQE
jgi:pSer/pThr/pTyr-binding forkhead associated (FHA) protein